MDRTILAEQINQMAEALGGTDEEIQVHLLARQAGFSWGEGWIMAHISFATIEEEEGSLPSQHTGIDMLHDPRILMPEEGDAKISYRDEDEPGEI